MLIDLDRLDALYEQAKDGWTDGDIWYLWWPEWVLAIGEAYPELREELVRLREDLNVRDMQLGWLREEHSRLRIEVQKDWHEIQKLKAENERLREAKANHFGVIAVLQDECERLREENAKLLAELYKVLRIGQRRHIDADDENRPGLAVEGGSP